MHTVTEVIREIDDGTMPGACRRKPAASPSKNDRRHQPPGTRGCVVAHAADQSIAALAASARHRIAHRKLCAVARATSRSTASAGRDDVGPALYALLEELRAPSPEASAGERIEPARSDLFVPFRIRTEQGVLAFIGTITVFGTPMDVTLRELAIESLFPADAFAQ